MITLERLWKRDRRRCFYCGVKVRFAVATRDHVIPKSIGGRDALRNLVLACGSCNERKAALIPFMISQEVFYAKRHRNTVVGEIKAMMKGAYGG